MATVHELKKALALYLDEMDRCAKAECYWALLHLVLVLPDICAALETYNGASSGLLYEDWCGRYLPKDKLKPLDRYKIRCSVLHQGSTLPHAKSQYRSVSFVQPGQAPTEVHQQVSADGKNITISVKTLADEMVAGIQMWIEDLQLSENENLRRTVGNNLRSLARVQRKVLRTETLVHHFNPTSST